MQYMLLCCIDEEHWNDLPASNRDAVMADYNRLIQDWVMSGHYRGGGKLQPAATATTLRQQGQRLVTLDGPYAEAREQLGGFHVLECGNLDEALAEAGRIPPLRVGGSVEVRPLDPSHQL